MLQSIFYHIDFDLFLNILDEALIDVDKRLFIEMLDLDKDFKRIESDLELEEILEISTILDKKYLHPVFILRKFPNIQKNYIEIGIGVCFNNKTYFIFCFIPPERLDYFVDMYELKQLK